ncbi:MAG: hypothetical protein J0665_21155 [Deltaproteobacteria bacterium]|jgi:hypothetical protein|nr:hypothetical protein [Deltaproteobacteria bacterium]
MLGFIKNLLGPKKPPPFDMEKAVGNYLLNLPKCTSKVVVTSPKYGDKCYQCEVLVDVNGLLPWAKHHAQAVWSGDKVEQAARIAIPLWLQDSNCNNPEPSYVPPYFVAVLRPYTLDFVNKGIAEIVCPDCNRIVDNVQMKKLNEKRSGGWSNWTDEWHCPAGHLLYREDHELHFHLR